MSEFKPKGAPDYTKKKYVKHKDLPSGKPYLQVSVSTSLKVDYVPTKMEKKKYDKMAKGTRDKLIKEFKKIGLTIKVDRDDLAELANTLYSFAGDKYSEIGSAAFTFLCNASQSDEGHKKHWEDIAQRAVNHMRIMAYKTPREKRGGAQLKHLYGKSAADPTVGTEYYARGTSKGKGKVTHPSDALSWVAGYYKGPKDAPPKAKKMYEAGAHPRQVKRTGRLRDSIGYTIDYDSDESGTGGAPSRTVPIGRLLGRIRSRIKKRAYGFRIGPGAGRKKAPPYAMAANYGRSPMSGVHYTPQDYFGDSEGGALTKGGSWPGFEGKLFLEETVEWMRREESKGVWTPRKYARAHIAKALMETNKRFPTIDTDLYEQLERTAIKAIMGHNTVVSEELIKKLIHQIQGYT